MWKRHLSFSISFFLIALLDIFIEIFDISQARLFIKPLICIILGGYLVNKTRLYGNFSKLIFGGLLFSLAGDIALLFAGKGGVFFIAGLSAFLVAHIFYAIAFFRDYKYDPDASKKYGHLMLFIMSAFTIGFYVWIRPYLADLRIPVMAYMIVISLMAIMAGYRYGRVNLLSFQLVLSGAIFFIISDVLLAINKFVYPFVSSGVFIMATYMAAQFLITIGALERVVFLKERSYR
ncbi:lysoplasmalogenase [Flavihumibacter sp. R14]|nr:lysoplasmalogenase [Flavihumibacter soli]